MTELEKRKRDYFSELAAYRQWDSEFSVNPHDPRRAMAKLAELGEEALPFFIESCRSPKGDWEDRLFGIHGIECLGDRAGAEGLAELETFIGEGIVAARAASAIERIKPERFWELKLHTNIEAVESLTREHRDAGTAATWIARVLALGDEKSSAAALKALFQVKVEERELILELRKALLSPFATVRAEASRLLVNVPNSTPVEALIEGMVTSGVVLVEPVAWHPDSVVFAPLLAKQKRFWLLAPLLERRRCAGLSTPAEPLIDAIDQELRSPKRSRYDGHDLINAAHCARELGAEALIPALVEAVSPLITASAADSLAGAFRRMGSKGRAALELAKETPELTRKRVIDLILERLSRNGFDLSFADRQFVEGSIDDGSTGNAFIGYSSVLREGSSAHAAFQLAWIDRAFGAEILPSRIEWIRSMGLHDEALLKEVATPVIPLEGTRSSWRTCSTARVDRVVAAGLPGLAFSGSRDPAHTEAAKAHVARVKAACS